MRQAIQSTVPAMLLVGIGLASAFILIETASAVEVSGAGDPVLPIPGQMANSTPGSPLVQLAPSEDSFILAARSFTIPFTVDASGSQPVEVRLYVSQGANDQWRMLSHKRPDASKPQFEFAAEADGEYWFATRTIDADGNSHPKTEIQPQLKVYVDTTKPIVDLTLDASSDGRIEAGLAIVDSTPIQTVVARYVTDVAKQWQTIDGKTLITDGRIQFLPAQPWERLSMHIVVTDKAGNQTAVTRQVQRPRVAELPTNRYSESQAVPDRTTVSERVNSQTVSSPVIRLDRNRKDQAQYQTAQYQTDLPLPSGYSQRPSNSPIGGYRGGVPTTSQPSTPFFRPAANPTANQFSNPEQNQVATPIPNQASRSGNSIFNSLFGAGPLQSMVAAQRPAAPIPSGDAEGPRLQLPAPSASNGDSNGFGLQGLGLNGPQQTDSSPASPEIVPTPGARQDDVQRDIISRVKPPAPEQQTTPEPRTATEAMRPLSEKSRVPRRELIPTPKPERHRADRPAPPEPPRSPVRHSDSERFSLDYELQAVGNLGVDAIELYGSVDGGETWDLWGTDPDRSSPFDIETKEEGVFSFRIVVVGRNGLASPRPQAGETPDIVVVVDKEKPKVRITAAQYGEGNRIGALVIRYECIDPNLEPRPISLSFSDSTSGPWTTIAAGLRNEGDYVWPADPKLPRQIYLRIDAKDGAGNVGTYILDKPIDVQGLAPRARIRGFQSLSGTEAFPVDEQTAERPSATFK